MDKEIKNQYKQKKFRKGVFQIRNISNGKIFIGCGKDLDKNWNSHHFRLKMGMHEAKELQKEWNELGEDYFVFEVLGELKEKEDVNADYDKDLKELVTLFIEELKPFGDKGYNKERQL